MPGPETLYVLAFGDRTIVLTAEEFKVGLERGQALTSGAASPPPANGAVPLPLCTAEEMEQYTRVRATWFLDAARRGEIPHYTFGKYKRFDPAEVRDSTRFRSRTAQGAGGKAP